MAKFDVVIPPMGESISSGVLAKWHVQNGDLVKKDQVLYELETDKITSEGLAEASGRITFKVEEGTEVKIGQAVASIDTEAAGAAPAAAPTTAAAAAAAPASPAVRRISEETGVDPSKVAGSGKAGRVTKGDMLSAVEAAAAKPVAQPPAPAPKPAPAAAQPTVPVITPNSTPRQNRRRISPLRAKIAQRLISAQHDAAMLTTFNEVDMSAVMALRAKYQDEFVKRNGIKLGFMSFFVKAVVHALQEVPAVNTMMDGDFIVENHFFDIGVAVSTDKGLLVPVVRDCDKLPMAGVEKSLADAATKAREGRIALADLDGGVFTITNGGIFGSMLSTPIINPPQCAILGMHAIQERAVVRDGQIVIRPMMYLALSYDHRLVDGREAVTFLVKVKQAIEDPSRLLLSL
ncbi:dihydrolipoyllysine-residue succinyltransferase component of 2-oxoglutarate dehydrogenase complex [mine drainage metagenome]|uniref:dihydrolipoyllysine-residue succinyltransferase n=1 Tax=mine drainage metagenome TaxID=410659 RepID=A0A1J5SIC4_9ZZZZ